jgi:hypothetical protein
VREFGVRIILSFLVAGCLGVAASAAGGAPSAACGEKEKMTVYDATFQKNRVSSLLNRWFIFYEVAHPSLKNQLDLMTEDFSVDAPIGKASSKADYELKVQKFLTPTDENSHNILELNIESAKNGIICANAKVKYVNRTPEGKISASLLSYKIIAEKNQNHTPQTKIN